MTPAQRQHRKALFVDATRARKRHANAVDVRDLLCASPDQVATGERTWTKKRLKKALSQVEHARRFGQLHQKAITSGNTLQAARLLSPSAPGASSWLTCISKQHKSLSGDEAPRSAFSLAPIDRTWSSPLNTKNLAPTAT